jgi:hypothetical protein
MRRYAASFALFSFLLSTAVAWASEGKVCKVLPQFLDKKGRQSLSPSLYERDAYQAYLRKHPLLRTGLRVEVQYKAKGLDWDKARLRAELRGLLTNSIATVTLEEPVKKSGFFANWAEFNISGDEFKNFGELVAWRVTLWEGDKQLSEQQSFLWSGVPVSSH